MKTFWAVTFGWAVFCIGFFLGLTYHSQTQCVDRDRLRDAQKALVELTYDIDSFVNPDNTEQIGRAIYPRRVFKLWDSKKQFCSDTRE